MASKVVKSAVRPPNAGKGRVKGVPNKVTKAVKEMVIAALEQAGGIDYLVEQSAKNPTAFMSLVGKVLPLQLTGEDGGPVKVSRIEIVAPGHDA
jgi:hypothetical protein